MIWAARAVVAAIVVAAIVYVAIHFTGERQPSCVAGSVESLMTNCTVR